MKNLNFFYLFINRIYYCLFKEYFNKKLQIIFPKKIFRWHLINFLIKKKKFKKYLEIGCDKNQTFLKIMNIDKIGVDPISGGTIRATSDIFFKSNKIKFDIIFIDGLHHYNHVFKDISNSIKILKKGGLILVHDCLPRSMANQAVPRYRATWNGDVWKAIVKLRTFKYLDIYTCKIDTGISVIKLKKNSSVLKIKQKNFKKLMFKDYYYNYIKYMRVINYSDFIKII